MATGSSSQTRPSRLLTQQDRLARTYDEEVYPLIGQKLADLLMADLTPVPRAHVLQLGCGLGATTAVLLRKLDPDSRLIVVEATPALLERARAGVEGDVLGKRLFFRAHAVDDRLPFAEDGFEHVLANVVLAELASPASFVGELARVTKPGGELRLATPVAGSWGEFLDVYSDVLVRLRREDAAEALARYRANFPDPEAVAAQLEGAGMRDVTVETVRWELIFRTGREFFYSPVIELGPLPRWKALAGKGAEMQDTFLAVKQAIDTYFGGTVFTVGIVASAFRARKA
jgi:ubiquinone/menaquinone biosynthesis C-methylase UbiE